MVNQVRTLLLNVSASASPGFPYPGEEYVPPTFNALKLQPELQRVRDGLFGQGADRALRNWRLRELMSILHSCELAQFVTAPDPRITYLPFDNSLLDAVTAGFSVNTLVNSGQTLTLLSTPFIPPYANTIYLRWLLTVVSSTQVQVTTYAPTGVTTVLENYVVTNGLSSLVTLPGSGTGVQFTTGVGGSWLISALARPMQSLPAVYAGLLHIVDPNVGAVLFGVNPVEPFLTFSNLWYAHPQMPYRLGGLTLALAYQTGLLLN